MILRNLLFAGIILSACSRVKTPELPADLPVDFQVFYELFHRDSAYQMEHIVFPLAGLPDYAEPELLGAGSYFWQEEDWAIHRQRTKEDKEFVRDIAILSNEMIRERLVHKERPLMTERRFAKMGDEWFLIYYAGINTYTQASNQ